VTWHHTTGFFLCAPELCSSLSQVLKMVPNILDALFSVPVARLEGIALQKDSTCFFQLGFQPFRQLLRMKKHLYPKLTHILRLLEPGCLIQVVTVQGYQNPPSVSRNQGKESVWSFSQSLHKGAADVGAWLIFRQRCNFVIHSISIMTIIRTRRYVACVSLNTSVFIES